MSTEEELEAKRTMSAIALWLLEKGFIRDGGNLCKAFDPRSGYDFCDLEFFPLARYDGDLGWDAIIGHHASGTNPRMILGTCETLEEVQMVYHCVSTINDGYDPERNAGRKVSRGRPEHYSGHQIGVCARIEVSEGPLGKNIRYWEHRDCTCQFGTLPPQPERDKRDRGATP